jgi:hypothetical protein
MEAAMVAKVSAMAERMASRPRCAGTVRSDVKGEESEGTLCI